jgi:hypothetical protein
MGLIVTVIVTVWVGANTEALACTGGKSHMSGHMAGHDPEHQQHHDGVPGIDDSCHELATARRQLALEMEVMDTRLAGLMEALDTAPPQDKDDAAMAVIDELERQRTVLLDQLVNVQPTMTAHFRQHMEEGTLTPSDCALYQEMTMHNGDQPAVVDEKAAVDEHAAHRH